MKVKQPLKGMRDILPVDAKKRLVLKSKIADVYLERGFLPIETPALENISNLISDDAGENSKLVFQVLKRGDKLNLNTTNPLDLVDMGLRFDLTLPLTRYYSANISELPSIFKVFQLDNVWRGERPQKGRFRQFMQCDIDIIGDASINAEIDILTTGITALKSIGLEDFTISINDRRILNQMAIESGVEDNLEKLFIELDKLDKIGEEKVITSLLAEGFSEDVVKTFINKINNLSIDMLDEYAHDLNTIIQVVSAYSNIKVKFDPTLVRGMGYYTSTVYEIKDETLNMSIAGGGRYDNLIEQFANISTPACGFSLGFERILLILDKQLITNETKNVVLIDRLTVEEYNELFKQLPANTSIMTIRKNLKKQLLDLTELGYTHYCIYKGSLEFKELNNA